MKFVFLYLSLILFTCSVFCKTVIVDKHKKDAIKETLNLCSDGDTILIPSAVYYEKEIVIRKRVIIIGENYPVIDGQNKFQLFIVNASGVVIKGLVLQNTGRSSMTDIAGIKVVQSSGVNIVKNKFINTTYGIYLQNVDSCFIMGNEITGNAGDELNNGNGIHAWKSKRLNIAGNHVKGHRDGIYFEFVTNSKISNNISEYNMRYGLHFMFSNDDIYSDNSFIANGSGVAVMYSKRVEMYRNSFKDNWGDASYAILLKEISDSKIKDNSFIKNTMGIYMEGTSRIITSNNLFLSNGWAMRIQASCDDNVFEHNNFIGNSFDVGTNGTMALNIFRQNYWDKYDGYDINHDGMGDIPYYPVSLYSVIIERVPVAMILYRSLLTDMMDKVEKLMPTLIPDKLKDDQPLIRKIN